LPHWLPTWQQSLGAAVVLAVTGVLLRRGSVERRGRLAAAVAGEFGVILGLYALWQLAGSLAVGSTAAGLRRGEEVWSLERVLHLPLETSVQALALPHPDLVRAMNAYYVYAHYNTLLLTLLWLFVRHRDRYPAARATLALATFASLALQLIAVAPPRLLGDYHIVDTALRYGQSVYGPATTTGISDQYSAMPSVHVVWASLVAVLVWKSAPPRWCWLGPAHAVLTTFVVVATGNHYWLDAAAGIGVLALALVVVGAAGRWRGRRRPPHPSREGEPERLPLLQTNAS
jgi:hypothetical protein